MSTKLEITSPVVLYIMHTIKAIQARMREPDLINSEYITIYDTLGREFQEFSDEHTAIFTKVIRGESLATIASVLYFKDKEEKGAITESQISDMLATKYLPTSLKQESDAKMAEGQTQ